MNRGFFLGELLLSLALGSIIFILGAQAAVTLSCRSLALVKESSAFMALLNASYVVERSLAFAPRDKAAWDELSESRLSWRTQMGKNSLYLEGKDLILCQATGYPNEVKSCILKGLSAISFVAFTESDVVQGVSYVMNNEQLLVSGMARCAGATVIAADWV